MAEDRYVDHQGKAYGEDQTVECSGEDQEDCRCRAEHDEHGARNQDEDDGHPVLQTLLLWLVFHQEGCRGVAGADD